MLNFNKIESKNMQTGYLEKCECCGEMYDTREEDKEVAESGDHICPDCWSEEE